MGCKTICFGPWFQQQKQQQFRALGEKWVKGFLVQTGGAEWLGFLALGRGEEPIMIKRTLAFGLETKYNDML